MYTWPGDAESNSEGCREGVDKRYVGAAVDYGEYALIIYVP